MSDSEEDSVHLNTPPKGKGVCCAKEFCLNRTQSYYPNYKCVVCKGYPHEQGCFTLGEILCAFDPDKVVCLRCKDNQEKREKRKHERERQKRRREWRKWEREKEARVKEERIQKIKKRNPFTIALENAERSKK
jgi:hypothetical protein